MAITKHRIKRIIKDLELQKAGAEHFSLREIHEMADSGDPELIAKSDEIIFKMLGRDKEGNELHKEQS